jgi:hypothetical protein
MDHIYQMKPMPVIIFALKANLRPAAVANIPHFITCLLTAIAALRSYCDFMHYQAHKMADICIVGTTCTQ